MAINNENIIYCKDLIEYKESLDTMALYENTNRDYNFVIDYIKRSNSSRDTVYIAGHVDIRGNITLPNRLKDPKSEARWENQPDSMKYKNHDFYISTRFAAEHHVGKSVLNVLGLDKDNIIIYFNPEIYLWPPKGKTSPYRNMGRHLSGNNYNFYINSIPLIEKNIKKYLALFILRLINNGKYKNKPVGYINMNKCPLDDRNNPSNIMLYYKIKNMHSAEMRIANTEKRPYKIDWRSGRSSERAREEYPINPLEEKLSESENIFNLLKKAKKNKTLPKFLSTKSKAELNQIKNILAQYSKLKKELPHSRFKKRPWWDKKDDPLYKFIKNDDIN